MANHWTDSWTLNDYIVSLVKNRQTESAEFKTMLRIYGREKLEQIWKAHREKSRSSERKAELLELTGRVS